MRFSNGGISHEAILPPELIIQDELHLISGPLGTMVGLYETAVDFLSRVQKESGAVVPSKVIASTATIRRAPQQVRQLYDRDLQVFPPSGLSSKDSFFAREIPTHDKDRQATDSNAGRLYVGVNASGSSSKTLLVRVYAGLLHAGLDHLVDPAIAQSGDPFEATGQLFGLREITLRPPFSIQRDLLSLSEVVESTERDVILNQPFGATQRSYAVEVPDERAHQARFAEVRGDAGCGIPKKLGYGQREPRMESSVRETQIEKDGRQHLSGSPIDFEPFVRDPLDDARDFNPKTLQHNILTCRRPQ